MPDIVDTKIIIQLIKNTENPCNPTHCAESLNVLERWINDPTLILDPEQQAIIENVLRKHGRF